MKKSLVITTIATILVIVVALTTATFAWFSSGSQSNVTSSFTAQADNAAFSFSKWEGTDYAVTSSTTIDFTDAEGLYGTTPYAYWSTNGLKAVAPINEIDTGTIATFASSDEVAAGMAGVGLPSEPFYSAQAVAGNTSVSAITYLNPKNLTKPASGQPLDYPNIARFSMTNIKSYDQAVQVTVTITPNDRDNSNDVRAASALRFVLIAKPLSGDPTGFVLASQYNYGIKNSGTDIFSGTTPSDTTATSATYTPVATANEDGLKRIIAAQSVVGQDSVTYQLLAAGLPSTGTQEASYTKAKMAAQASYAMYLYVWLDGTTVGASASQGGFTFTIAFTGQELTAAVSP